MSKLDTQKLVRAAALAQFEEFAWSTLPDLAIELLLEGTESESLILLAGESEYTDVRDLRELFYATLGELGVRVPTLVEAALFARNQIANEVAGGRLSPRAGALQLLRLSDRVSEEFDSENALGLDEIVSLSYYYDDWYQGECGQLNIDAAIVKECMRIAAGVEH